MRGSPSVIDHYSVFLRKLVFMFEDKVDREELDKMPSEYKELLERVLTIQADCEIGGPHLYVKDIFAFSAQQSKSVDCCAHRRRRNGSLSQICAAGG